LTALVVDASAVVDYLRATPRGLRVAARIEEERVELHVPHLCPVEVASALRGLVLGGKASAEDAQLGLDDLADLSAQRHPVEPYLPRIWVLRDNLTVYDATYVALAEALDAVLVTTDGELAPKYRHYATVETIS